MADITLADARIDISTTGVRGVQRDLNLVQRELSQTSRAAQQSGSAFAVAGQRSRAGIAQMASGFQAALGPITAVTAALTAVGAGALTVTTQLGNLSRQMDGLTARSGLSAQALNQFANVINRLGGENGLEAVADAGRELNLRLGELATTGAGPAAEALRVLNINAENLLRLSSDQRFRAITDALRGVESVQVRQYLTEELFGGQGAEQFDLYLSANADRLAELEAATRDLTDAQLAAGRMVSDSTSNLGDALGNLGREIGTTFAPAIIDASNSLANLADSAASAVVSFRAWRAAFETAYLRQGQDVTDRIEQLFGGRLIFPESEGIQAADLEDRRGPIRASIATNVRRIRRGGGYQGDARIPSIEDQARGSPILPALRPQPALSAAADESAARTAANRQRRIAQLREDFARRSRRIEEDRLRNRNRLIASYNDRREDLIARANADRIRAEESVSDRLLEIEERYQQRRQAIYRRYNRRLEDIDRRSGRDVSDVRDAEPSFARRNIRIAEIQLQAQRDREDAALDRDRSLADLDRETADQRVAVAADVADRLREIEANLSQNLADLALQREQALAEFDAAAKLAAQRRAEDFAIQLARLQEAAGAGAVSTAVSTETTLTQVSQAGQQQRLRSHYDYIINLEEAARASAARQIQIEVEKQRRLRSLVQGDIPSIESQAQFYAAIANTRPPAGPSPLPVLPNASQVLDPFAEPDFRSIPNPFGARRGVPVGDSSIDSARIGLAGGELVLGAGGPVLQGSIRPGFNLPPGFLTPGAGAPGAVRRVGEQPFGEVYIDPSGRLVLSEGGARLQGSISPRFNLPEGFLTPGAGAGGAARRVGPQNFGEVYIDPSGRLVLSEGGPRLRGARDRGRGVFDPAGQGGFNLLRPQARFTPPYVDPFGGRLSRLGIYTFPGDYSIPPAGTFRRPLGTAPRGGLITSPQRFLSFPGGAGSVLRFPGDYSIPGYGTFARSLGIDRGRGVFDPSGQGGFNLLRPQARFTPPYVDPFGGRLSRLGIYTSPGDYSIPPAGTFGRAPGRLPTYDPFTGDLIATPRGAGGQRFRFPPYGPLLAEPQDFPSFPRGNRIGEPTPIEWVLDRDFPLGFQLGDRYRPVVSGAPRTERLTRELEFRQQLGQIVDEYGWDAALLVASTALGGPIAGGASSLLTRGALSAASAAASTALRSSIRRDIIRSAPQLVRDVSLIRLARLFQRGASFFSSRAGQVATGVATGQGLQQGVASITGRRPLWLRLLLGQPTSEPGLPPAESRPYDFITRGIRPEDSQSLVERFQNYYGERVRRREDPLASEYGPPYSDVFGRTRGGRVRSPEEILAYVDAQIQSERERRRLTDYLFAHSALESRVPGFYDYPTYDLDPARETLSSVADDVRRYYRVRDYFRQVPYGYDLDRTALPSRPGPSLVERLQAEARRRRNTAIYRQVPYGYDLDYDQLRLQANLRERRRISPFNAPFGERQRALFAALAIGAGPLAGAGAIAGGSALGSAYFALPWYVRTAIGAGLGLGRIVTEETEYGRIAERQGRTPSTILERLQYFWQNPGFYNPLIPRAAHGATRGFPTGPYPIHPLGFLFPELLAPTFTPPSGYQQPGFSQRVQNALGIIGTGRHLNGSQFFITLEGDIYGIDDLEDRIIEAVGRAEQRGAAPVDDGYASIQPIQPGIPPFPN